MFTALQNHLKKKASLLLTAQVSPSSLLDDKYDVKDGIDDEANKCKEAKDLKEKGKKREH